MPSYKKDKSHESSGYDSWLSRVHRSFFHSFAIFWDPVGSPPFACKFYLTDSKIKIRHEKKISWLLYKFSMADREGRKAELERKKARLLAMRAEKNKKEVTN